MIPLRKSEGILHTSEFVIKKEHLGFLPDLAISKRQ
jgi:hypothetical protein